MKAAIAKKKISSPEVSLRDEFHALTRQTGEAMMRLNFEDKRVYLKWVEEHHYLVKRTMRYICLAAGLAPAEDDTSFSYWHKALKEETNHHKMLENDARYLGADPHKFRAGPITQALAARVYEDMITSGGRALFGYALLLEGLSCTIGKEFMLRVQKAHGPKAATFLQLHTIVDDGDDGHFAHGLDFLDENYDEASKHAIRELLRESARAYAAMLESISK